MKIEDLNKNDNIVGHGRGYKITKGKQTKKMARIIFVKEKLPKAKLKKEEIIPKKIGKEITDVIEVGNVVALSKMKKKIVDRKDRHRPSPCGVSIGHEDTTAGTQGAIVLANYENTEYDWLPCDTNPIITWIVKTFTNCELMKKIMIPKEGIVRMILSNNHVLANECMENEPIPVGDLILQPGPYDGGNPKDDAIGELYDAVPLKKSNNTVDAALAMPFSQADISDHILDIGLVAGTATAKVGEVIKKSGRTTGFTEAKVIAIDATINISYDNGVLQFVKQIVTDYMSDGGDSGSLVLNDKNEAIGLLFAGSNKVTLINPISEVMDALNIKFK